MNLGPAVGRVDGVAVVNKRSNLIDVRFWVNDAKQSEVYQVGPLNFTPGVHTNHSPLDALGERALAAANVESTACMYSRMETCAVASAELAEATSEHPSRQAGKGR